MTSGQVAGSNISTSRELLRQMIPETAFERGLARLTPEERAAYFEVGMLGWVPLPIVDKVMVVMAEETSTTPERLVVELTHRVQEKLLHTLYRVLMRVVTDEALISRTGAFYAKVYDTGRLSSTFPEPGKALVTLSGFPGISDLQIVALGAGVEATLRCAGRKDARAVGRRQADGALYTCTWRT